MREVSSAYLHDKADYIFECMISGEAFCCNLLSVQAVWRAQFCYQPLGKRRNFTEHTFAMRFMDAYLNFYRF